MQPSRRRLLVIGVLAIGVVLVAYAIVSFGLFPTRIESYKAGAAHGFSVGMIKVEAFDGVKAMRARSIASREGSELQIYPSKFTEALKKSNYWIIERGSHAKYLLVFRDDKVWRIIAYFPKFGELDGTPESFNVDREKPDIFEGMSHEQVDELLKQNDVWCKVYLR